MFSLFDKNSSRYLGGVIFALGLAVCQVGLFIVLHDAMIRLVISMGQPSHVRGGVGWGITIYFSVFILAAICLISSFMSTVFFPKYGIYFHLIGFGIFCCLFIEDLLHLSAWAHPKRALLIIFGSFVAFIFPYLIFNRLPKLKCVGEEKWA